MRRGRASRIVVGITMLTLLLAGAGVVKAGTGILSEPELSSTFHMLNVSKTGSGTITSNPPGINCGIDCSELYEEGTYVNLAAIPEMGWASIGITCDHITDIIQRMRCELDRLRKMPYEEWAEVSSSATVLMDQAKNVTFIFIPGSILEVSKVGSGVVTSSPSGIYCGSHPGYCRELYANTTNVTLTATPAIGAAFIGWGDDCSGTGDCTLNMSGHRKVVAYFTLGGRYMLAVNKIGSGTITSSPPGINCGNDCDELYEDGTEVTLTATANSGWGVTSFVFYPRYPDEPITREEICNQLLELDRLAGRPPRTTYSCTITMDMAKTATVTFEPTSVNNPPNPPLNPAQFKSDGTEIPEGRTTGESTVNFKGAVSDPDGDNVRLEIELRRKDEPFTGEPTPETISDFVASGTEVSIARYGLVDGDYHWRYRAKDSKVAVSEWREFGAIGNVDFAVKPTPKFLTLPFKDPNIVVGWIFDPTSSPPHYGIDFIKDNWQSFVVTAAADGEAFWATHSTWGTYVYIKHDEKDIEDRNYYTLYSHLDSVNPNIPKEGRGVYRIQRGELIGKAGETGSPPGSTHLHFEVHKGDARSIDKVSNRVDPYDLNETRNSHYRKKATSIKCGPNCLWTTDPPTLAPVSANDIYWLAKAIMSEASIGTQEEQIAVGWTVLNRLDSGRFGSSVEDIVKSWYAYNQEPTEDITMLAKYVLERRFQDPTEGATHFFSPRSMPKEGDDTTGFDVGGGLHQVPYDDQDKKVWFPSWAKPEEGTEITEYTSKYLTVEKIPIKLEWRNLGGIRNWYFMFYRPYTTQIKAKAKSPVEFRIYDSEGLVTGLVNGETIIEIPGSGYYNNTVTIFFPFDSYQYKVVGKDEGIYGLTMTAVTIQENINFTATDIPTSTNIIHQYAIDWTALSQGEEGVTLQIDSNGDGTFDKTITSNNELTHDEYMLQTRATIDFDPDTLNLKSKGEVVTAYIELPEGYDVSQIDISTIKLNKTVPALAKPTQIGDHDSDGIADLMVKFDRVAVIGLFAGKPVPTDYVLEVRGTVKDVSSNFKGSDVIRVISRG